MRAQTEILATRALRPAPARATVFHPMYTELKSEQCNKKKMYCCSAASIRALITVLHLMDAEKRK